MARARGFTLIEMLLVVVIIGILVAVTVPRFSNTKERALVTAMKSDLRNLAAAEEAYFHDNTAYTSSLTLLPFFSPSVDVSVTVNEASVSGWSATAASSAVVRRCALFIGTAAPVGAATQEGQVACN